MLVRSGFQVADADAHQFAQMLAQGAAALVQAACQRSAPEGQPSRGVLGLQADMGAELERTVGEFAQCPLEFRPGGEEAAAALEPVARAHAVPAGAVRQGTRQKALADSAEGLRWRWFRGYSEV